MSDSMTVLVDPRSSLHHTHTLLLYHPSMCLGGVTCWLLAGTASVIPVKAVKAMQSYRQR